MRREHRGVASVDGPRGAVARGVGRVPTAPALVLTSAVVLLAQLPGRNRASWHWFHDAARLLVDDGPAGTSSGLRLYADRPDFQFGPLGVVAALPFSALGRSAGGALAMVVASALGLVALAFLVAAARRLLPHVPPSTLEPAVLVGGIAFLVTWGYVAVRTTHFDDALVLTAVAAALWGVAAQRPGLVTAMLALAAATKPWAIAFAPLVLVPHGRRPGWRLVAVGAFVAATWAPFVLAAPETLDTARHAIDNDPTSVLRALGVDDATTPRWVRPAQLIGGFAVAALLVARRRWHAVVLAAVAWRLLLEPGAHRYYTVGLVLGALLLELVVRPGRLPWPTVAAAAVLEVTALTGFPDVAGRFLRLAIVVAALAVAMRVRPLAPRSAVGQGQLTWCNTPVTGL